MMPSRQVPGASLLPPPSPNLPQPHRRPKARARLDFQPPSPPTYTPRRSTKAIHHHTIMLEIKNEPRTTPDSPSCPEVIQVYCTDDPLHRLKPIPLHKARTWTASIHQSVAPARTPLTPSAGLHHDAYHTLLAHHTIHPGHPRRLPDRPLSVA